MDFLEKFENFFKKIKKSFHWIKILWKVDDGSFDSLYEINIKQLEDMQNEFLKFASINEEYMEILLEMEEVKKNLFLAMKEKDEEVAKRYEQRAFEIMKQKSLEWWI